MYVMRSRPKMSLGFTRRKVLFLCDIFCIWHIFDRYKRQNDHAFMRHVDWQAISAMWWLDVMRVKQAIIWFPRRVQTSGLLACHKFRQRWERAHVSCTWSAEEYASQRGMSPKRLRICHQSLSCHVLTKWGKWVGWDNVEYTAPFVYAVIIMSDIYRYTCNDLQLANRIGQMQAICCKPRRHKMW